MSKAAIVGPLTLATVPQILRDGGDAGERLDLAACTRIDSAGAAYLLERTRSARQRGLTLQIVNANDQVKQLVRFFELEAILQLQ